MDKVVHFEIPVDDEARAKEFYGSMFDWDLNDADMGGGVTYTTVGTVETDERMLPKEPGAINGGIMKRSSDTPHPVITIQVDAIDDVPEEDRGRRRRHCRSRGRRSPTWARSPYFKDCEGNTMGLWETSR